MTFKKYTGQPHFRLVKYKSQHSHDLSDPMSYNERPNLRGGARGGGRPGGRDHDMTNYFLNKIRGLETDLAVKQQKAETETIMKNE